MQYELINNKKNPARPLSFCYRNPDEKHVFFLGRELAKLTHSTLNCMTKMFAGVSWLQVKPLLTFFYRNPDEKHVVFFLLGLIIHLNITCFASFCVCWRWRSGLLNWWNEPPVFSLIFLWRKIESSRRVLRTSHKMTNWQNALGVSTITPKGVTKIIFLQVSVSDKINWLSHEFQNISPTSIRLFFQLVQLSDLYLPKTSCINYNEKVASRLCWRDSAR